MYRWYVETLIWGMDKKGSFIFLLFRAAGAAAGEKTSAVGVEELKMYDAVTIR